VNTFITSKTQEIQQFIEQKKENINIKDKNVSDDVNKLLLVMENLHAINEERHSIMLVLDEIE